MFYCHSFYKFNDCFVKCGTRLVTKKCSNVCHSKKCSAALVKQVVSRSGSPLVYPIKAYYYCSLISALQRFLLRRGFVDLCEETRTLYMESTHLLSDVCQGRVWKELLLSLISFQLHYRMDSCWALIGLGHTITLVTLRVLFIWSKWTFHVLIDTCIKRQNIIKVGILPWPNERPLSVNSYLSPLVTELLQLWNWILSRDPLNTSSFLNFHLWTHRHNQMLKVNQIM